jgi:hypothetical protein
MERIAAVWSSVTKQDIRLDLEMLDSTFDVPQQEPSAVSLKAAYRLLKAMNESAEPPTIDTLAVMLENTLRYSQAVSLISEASDYYAGDGQMGATAQAFQEFVSWAHE